MKKEHENTFLDLCADLIGVLRSPRHGCGRDSVAYAVQTEPSASWRAWVSCWTESKV